MAGGSGFAPLTPLLPGDVTAPVAARRARWPRRDRYGAGHDEQGRKETHRQRPYPP
ncbi:MAG: hypothetical protein ACLGIZ_15290 [Acidimicrobiia bacterium]